MKKRIATEIRTALGWSQSVTDDNLNLNPGTWAKIENGQQTVAVKQLVALFKSALLRSFGAKTLQYDQLEEFKNELYKAQGIMLTLQQDINATENIKKHAANAIISIKKIEKITS
jgi:transcriptional regulator with XRE-family HTH domain